MQEEVDLLAAGGGPAAPVVGGAGVRHFPHPSQRQPQPSRVFEDVDGRVVRHRKEALIVHLQDLVTHLQDKGNRSVLPGQVSATEAGHPSCLSSPQLPINPSSYGRFPNP